MRLGPIRHHLQINKKIICVLQQVLFSFYNTCLFVLMVFTNQHFAICHCDARLACYSLGRFINSTCWLNKSLILLMFKSNRRNMFTIFSQHSFISTMVRDSRRRLTMNSSSIID
uniref:Uncharacterized protein n=1 Tax=Glossina austeni TaxID=7395 RepID=A0A1A9UUK3_GLOAU